MDCVSFLKSSLTSWRLIMLLENSVISISSFARGIKTLATSTSINYVFFIMPKLIMKLGVLWLESSFFSYNPGEASGMIFGTVRLVSWNRRSKGWSKERARFISTEFNDGSETLIDIVWIALKQFLGRHGHFKGKKHTNWAERERGGDGILMASEMPHLLQIIGNRARALFVTSVFVCDSRRMGPRCTAFTSERPSSSYVVACPGADSSQYSVQHRETRRSDPDPRRKNHVSSSFPLSRSLFSQQRLLSPSEMCLRSSRSAHPVLACSLIRKKQEAHEEREEKNNNHTQYSSVCVCLCVQENLIWHEPHPHICTRPVFLLCQGDGAVGLSSVSTYRRRPCTLPFSAPFRFFFFIIIL